MSCYQDAPVGLMASALMRTSVSWSHLEQKYLLEQR